MKASIEDLMLPCTAEGYRRNIYRSAKDCVAPSSRSFLDVQEMKQAKHIAGFRPGAVLQSNIINGLKRGNVQRPVY
jgi:hypothetical protein